MKKVFSLCMVCLLAMSAMAQQSEYVDLGLPSGTWWGKTNAGGTYARYTYDESVSKYGSKLPTKTQFEELKNYCTWRWATQNGVNGYKVTGSNGNSIFLPAAGYRDGSDVYGVQRRGDYWSATEYISDYEYCLYFSSDGAYMNINNRRLGQSVRLVKDL